MRTILFVLVAVLAGCARAPSRFPPSVLASAHLHAADDVEHSASSPSGAGIAVAMPVPDVIPAPVPVPVPQPAPVYSLDVRLVPVEQLLSAIARDQAIDFDLHPGVEGFVSLSAFDRSLPELFTRICEQAELRCEFDGARLAAMPDMPFLRAYHVDYVNLARDMRGEIATSTQIATSSSAVDGARVAGGGNASLTRIETRAANHFWDVLETSIRALLREHELHVRRPRCAALHRRDPAASATDAAPAPACAGAAPGEAAFVMGNREAGILMVLANARQHRDVAEFIKQVQNAAHRQVMIEATIVEVTLADAYHQGIDWNRLPGSRSSAPAIKMRPHGSNDATAMTQSITYLSDRIGVSLDLLETFGTVKVLSSPKLSVLNNQTAVLKVVEEVVYFLVDAATTEYGDSDREKITATTKPQSVSVGLVMALTPQIGRNGAITLSVRPTISSISGFKDDPNPTLGNIPNRVPQIRTREIESVLRLADGETAILGGLMEDKIDYDTGRVPLLGAVPVLGEIFTRRENSIRRTELVIFLRPRLLAGHPGFAARHEGDEAFLRNAPVPGERNFPADVPFSVPRTITP
ncbi:MAG: general secretion pathway protein GspD [Azoarcus sp.]|jgi:general secretion pathway protein D|nr:general secretion pathway protein GspD [Azoarcus sp.]